MYLFEKDEDSIVNKHYFYLQIFILMAMLVFIVILWNYPKLSYNLPNFVPNNLDKTKISRYKDIMDYYSVAVFS